MKQVEIEKIVESWARASQVGLLINKKSPYKFLASFREYCESNPKAFQPHKPLIQRGGSETEYNVWAVLYFFENQHLLEAGIKIEPFYNDLERLKSAYSYSSRAIA